MVVVVAVAFQLAVMPRALEALVVAVEVPLKRYLV
jgi:hypothetical protein